MNFLYVFQCISLIWFGCVNSVRLLGLVLHISRARICRIDNKHQETSSKVSGGVTILRPMLGVDDIQLYECLRSTFTQEYDGPLEIIMCVADINDPSIPVAQRLVEEFPAVQARIMVDPDQHYGINPKVNNLVKGYKAAAYDFIWCLDSNIVMHPCALQRSMSLFTRDIELVHHLPVAVAELTNAELPKQADNDAQTREITMNSSGWGGRLDETYMLTAHSTFYTGINAVGIAPCVTGKSNLYRRSALDKAVGAAHGCGLEHFAKYMAEDQMISEALWSGGGRTALGADAAVQPLGLHITLKDYWDRRARWIRLRKYMVTSATAVEPFTDTLFNCAFVSLINGWQFKTFLLSCLISFGIDTLNYRVLLGYTRRRAMPWSDWIMSWSTREVLAFPLWIWAMSGHKIWWRDHAYTIRKDLVAEPAD